MSNLTRKLRRQPNETADKYFPNMPMRKNRKSGRKGEHSARLFDAVSYFRSSSDLPNPPRPGVPHDLQYHATKGWRWTRQNT